MKDTIFLIGPRRIGSSSCIKIIVDTLIFPPGSNQIGSSDCSRPLYLPERTLNVDVYFHYSRQVSIVLCLSPPHRKGEKRLSNGIFQGVSRAGLSHNCHEQESAKTYIALLKPKKRGIAYSLQPSPIYLSLSLINLKISFTQEFQFRLSGERASVSLAADSSHNIISPLITKWKRAPKWTSETRPWAGGLTRRQPLASFFSVCLVTESWRQI